ncbi:MAG: ferrous iron transport protein A [Tissierellia bacterium]|nr:ferrous iron transport protein A [Tissierellia bacterium]
MNKLISLDKLPIGKSAIVKKLHNQGIVRRRLLDLGLIEGTRVRALMRSPAGDPTAYDIRGAVIALRKEETSKILVEQLD